jgi:hypothetical protein
LPSLSLEIVSEPSKAASWPADTRFVMDAAERKEILSRYVGHSRRFDEVAARRGNGNAEVIPFAAPLRELEQEPTAREIEVLRGPREPRDRAPPLSLGRDGEISCAASVGQAASAFTRSRRGRRLSPKPDRLVRPGRVGR